MFCAGGMCDLRESLCGSPCMGAFVCGSTRGWGNGLLDAEAAANVEDGLAGDAVEFAEPVDGGVVGLRDFV